MRLRFGNESNLCSLISTIALVLFSVGTLFASDDQPDGGTITTLDNTTLCIGDGIPDVINASLSGSAGDSSIWVLTNHFNVILRVQNDSRFSLGGLDIGRYHIVHIGYDEFSIGPVKGQNIKKLRGWFDLSNKLVVNVVAANGGYISTTHDQSLTICADDGFDDLIDVKLVSAEGEFQGWLITDQNGIILDLPSGPPFNFEGSGAGVCLIWHYAAIGVQPSLSIGQNASALSGCSDLSNPIQIIREVNCGINPCDVDGGMISTDQGLSELTICADDGISDAIQVLTVGASGDRIFLITDASGTILATTESAVFDFEGQGAGICLIWNLSFTDPVFGIVVGQNAADLQGCHELSNPITVTREIDCAPAVCEAVGGVIAIDASDAIVCVDDGINDNIQVSLTNNVGNSTWVATDENGVILALQSGSTFNFEGRGAGRCLIWHLSSIGTIQGAEVGNNASDITGCFSLSNSITIIREVNCGVQPCDVEGGSITTTSGLTELTLCVDDNISDMVSAVVTGNSGSSTWIVTDMSGNILLVMNEPSFDFEGTGAGECRIWHLSLRDPIIGLGVGRNVSGIDGCLSLSNPITVTREIGCGEQICEVDGGAIVLQDGSIATTVCVDDGINDQLVAIVSGSQGSSSLWVITDADGIILETSTDANFNFEGSSAGVCLIWNLSFDGVLTGTAVGDNANNIEGCHDLSNPITITRITDCGDPVCDVVGGSILSSDNQTELTVCVDDGVNSVITAIVSGNQGSSTWLVTDAQGNILMIQNDNNFGFEGADTGMCQIWHLSLSGDVAGFGIGQNVSDLSGCFELSNPITVTRRVNCSDPPCIVQGGTNATVEGETALTICVDDGIDDVVRAEVTGNVGSSVWVVTDMEGQILVVSNVPEVNFEGTGPGVCEFWHLSFEDPLTGFGIGLNAADLVGCFEFSNPIMVTREINCGDAPCDVEGGSIMTADGGTSLTVCVDDGIADNIEIMLAANTGATTWLVTDAAGIILAVQNSSTFNFENTGAGVFTIWHLAIDGPLEGFGIGQSALAITGCFDLSNPIEVVKEINCGNEPCDVEGGSIMTAAGGMAMTICADDGIADGIDIILAANTGSSTWFVTDSAGDIIVIQNSSTFNFEGAGAGVCTIWHLASDGPLEGFSIGQNVDDISGCFDLSNPIQITRLIDCGQPVCDIIAGRITLDNDASSVTICTSDDVEDIIDVTLTGNTGASTYLVTDSQGNILEIQNDPTFNFTGAPAGTCFIYHMSLQDPVTGFGLGRNISELGGCLALSNSIEVIRLDDCGAPVCDISAGSITLEDGSSSVSICLSDDISDVLSVVLTGNTGASTYIVADSLGTILNIQNDSTFDLAAAGGGLCFIYHMSLQDPVTGFGLGQNISGLGGCFRLSNPIEVRRLINCGAPECDVAAGTIALADGATSTTICIADDESDVLSVTLTGNSGASTYIVTDSDGFILNIQNDAEFNFEGVAAGVCNIYHMSLQDPVTGFGVGQNIIDLGGCFQLSNPIEVIRITDCGAPVCDLAAGTIALADGETSISICVTDDESDIISVVLTGNSGASTFIVTDSNGNILAIQNEADFNFDGVVAGTCFIYHMSLQDPLTGFVIGQNISGLEGCFQLSNAIQVVREDDCAPPECTVAGGNIVLMDGETAVTVCADDAVSDILQVSLTGNAGASTYVLTDADGVILDIRNDASFDFEGAGAGVCLLYHMSILDPLTGFMLGGNIADIEGCFSFSNAITVTRNIECGPDPCDEVLGGMITTVDGETDVTVCVTDGVDENIELVITGNSGARIWIVTNTENILLSVQTTPIFSFEGLEAGQCRIYSISLVDPVEGLEIGANMSDVVGCTSLSNAITINRETDCTAEMAMGGSLSLADGAEEITVCVDDGEQENITPVLTEAVGSVTWLVTDSSGIILAIQDAPPFNFEGLGEGVCLIWNLASLDSLGGVELGADAADITGEFSLSNPITVTRIVDCGEMLCTVVAGTIATTDGRTSLTLCADDGLSDVLDLQVSGNIGSGAWIQVDADGFITGISANPDFEFEGSAPGGCLVYHISLQEPITGFGVGELVADLDGCFALSNAFTIIKENDCEEDICSVDGGQIATSDGSTELTICADDGETDIINVLTIGSNSINTYIVTDTTGLIIAVQESGVFDFEGAGGGVCLIWNVSARDSSFVLTVGTDVEDLAGCFDLSNAIRVIKNTDCGVIPCDVDGGSIMTSDSLTTLTICADDGEADVVNVLIMGNTGISSYIVTDTLGMIIAVQESGLFDFEGAGGGVCLVWNVSARDSSFAVTAGTDVEDLSGCFDLSNSIRVIRNTGCAEIPCEVDGGSIMTSDSLTSLSICVDDEVSDLTSVILTGNVGIGTYIITNEAGIVLAVQDSSTFEFEGLGGGTCLIWHLSVRDSSFTVGLGEDVDNLEGCFDLSDPITVVRNTGCKPFTCEDVVAGTISFAASDGDNLSVCIDDGMDENIEVTLENHIGGSIWLITDANGLILDVQNESIFNFEGTTTGICVIRHLSILDPFSGIIPGRNIADAEGCFKPSNELTIDRRICDTTPCEVEGGTIMTTDDLTELTICANDGVSDMFSVDVMGNSGISSWLVTDTLGNVLQAQENNIFDFEGAGLGVCFVYHISTRDSSYTVLAGENTNDLMGCFDLSNPIRVNRETDCINLTCESVSAGTISILGGMDSVTVCINDGQDEELNIQLVNERGGSIWAITDMDGVILDLENEGPFNFEGIAEGTCLIRHLGLLDPVTGLIPGNNLSDVEGCVKASNPIIVIRQACVEVCDVDGGSIATAEGLTDVNICADDGVPDPIDIVLTGNVGPNSIYIVADSTGMIMGLQLESTIDLEGAGAGLCYIYHASLRDSITGAELEQNINDFSNCIDVSNPIRIFRDGGDFEGGMIVDADGNTETSICGTDGLAAEIDVTLTGNTGDFSVWLMTDSFDNILFFYDTAPPFEVEDGDLETYRLYHMSYSAQVVGLQGATNLGNIQGCFDLSNPYIINMLTECDMTECTAAGGSISVDGETVLTVCVDDELDENIAVALVNTVGDSSVWLITDTTGIILELPAGPPFNFEGIDTGVCLIWHLSYSGELSGVTVGANANDITGCAALSNAIRVTREDDCAPELCTAQGGTINTGSDDTSFSVCVDDGVDDTFAFTVDGIAGDSSVWLITDTMAVIISLQTSGDFNFEGVDPGTCLVWHLSYNDSIIGAEAGLSASALQGCFNLSEPIRIVRESDCGMAVCTAAGGSIMTSDSLTMIRVCTDDNLTDSLEIMLTGSVGDSSIWVITDTSAIILELLEEAPEDFEGVAAGTCLVWHLSYNDSITGAVVGLNANDITGCHSLSNPITVVRENDCAAEPCLAQGGTQVLSDGTTQMTICAGDGIDDTFSIMLTDTMGSSGVWIATDTLGMIILTTGTNEFNFESAGAGVCLVYHLGFIDGVNGASAGDNISGLSGCFQLSNPIRVDRETDCMECVAVGGVITLDDGFQSAMLCTGDGMVDEVMVSLTTEMGDSSTYIVTDTSGMILAIQNDTTFEFDGAGPGICQIWHVSWIDTLTGLTVGQNTSALSGCFDLSNPIMITRTNVDGGMVNLRGGATEVTICVMDSLEDFLSFENDSESDMDYIYLLTDDQNRFLVTSMDSSGFNNLGAGTCRVYGLSYAGTANFSGISQMDITTIPFSDCFDISDNFITVTRLTGDDCPDGSFRYGEVNFAVSENPVRDNLELQIKSESLEGKVWVEVRSINGQLMKSESMDLVIGQMTKTIDVSDVAPGLYFVTIRNNVISKNERIIIQR